MRKLLTTLSCLLLMAGLVAANEVTLVKYETESKELTVKDGDAERTYTVTNDTKFSAVDKKSGESKELTYDKALLGLTSPKSEGRLKIDLIVKGGEVVEAKLPGKKK